MLTFSFNLKAKISEPYNNDCALLFESTKPLASLKVLNSKKQQFDFKLISRSPAERLFKIEAKIIEDSKPEDLIPVEIMYLPYYAVDAGLALRAGNSFYHMTISGWKLSSGGVSSAKSNIFYNPYYRKRSKRFQDVGMPNFSIGSTFMIPKVQYLNFQKIINGELVDKKTTYNLLFRNCSQCLVLNLGASGVDRYSEIDSWGALSSSHVFRELLNTPPEHHVRNSIYPLPDTPQSHDYIVGQFPEILLHDYSDIEHFLSIMGSYIKQKLRD